jgi:hypothetical protein
MFCGECGKNNPEGSIFCDSCGARFVAEQALAPSTVNVKKGINRIALLFGAIAAIALIGSGAYFLSGKTAQPLIKKEINPYAAYFPIKAGSKWEYAVKSNKPSIHYKADPAYKKKYYRTTRWTEQNACETVEILDGERFVKCVESSSLPGQYADVHYVRIDRNGLYYGNRLFIPFPLTKGKVWNYETKHTNGTGTFLGYQDLTTGGKEYRNCLVVQYDSYVEADKERYHHRNILFYASGIGLVKKIYKNITQKLVQESNLSNYTP